MNNKDIKNILTGIALLFLVVGQFFILSGSKNIMLGIIFTVIFALIFALAITGKFTVIIDIAVRLSALMASFFAPKIKAQPLKGAGGPARGSKKPVPALPAPVAAGLNPAEFLKKFGREGLSFFIPKWMLFAFSVVLFIIAQFFFISGNLIMALMFLSVIVIVLIAAFRMKTTGIDMHINLGSGLKVLSMVSGLVLISIGWVMLLNQKITVQEWGVVLTIPGCILAYLALPNRKIIATDEPETRSDILFLNSGILNNQFVKIGLIILAGASLWAGSKVMMNPDMNMYSMIFYGIAIVLAFFSFPLFNFAEKPMDNKLIDVAKLVVAALAIILAYFGQRDFMANKVNDAIVKYLISAFMFIVAFPIYSSKVAEEKEPFPIKAEVIFLIVIMLIGLFLRIYEIDLRPFGLENDEAGGYTARLNSKGEVILPLSVGNFGIGAHIVQLFIGMFGELNRFTIKMLGVTVGFLSIPIMYFFIRSLLNPRAAIFATTLFTFLRWNLHYSRSGHGYVLSNAVEVLAFYFLFKAIETRKTFVWFLAGLCVGLSWHGVMTAFLLIIPVVLYFIISAFSRKDFLKANMVGIFAFLFGFWIFGSMIVHNFFLSKTIYFARVNEVSVFSKDPNAPSKNPAKGIVDNTKLVLLMFNHMGDSRQRNSGGNPNEPTIDFTSSMLYAIGFIYTIYYSKYYMFFILVMVFFSQAAGSIFSIEAPSVMRAVGVIVPMMFFIAFIFDKLWLSVRRVFGKKYEFIYLPVILAIFLVPIIKDNYTQYFGRWVGGMDELTTATGLYTKSLGEKWRIMLYTNTYYPGHPPFKINRKEKANTSARLTTALTFLKHVDTDNFAMLFHYDTWQNFDSIKHHYFPESKVEDVDHKWFNKKLKQGEGWGLFAKAILVTNEDLAKKRGLTANYSFGSTSVFNDLPVFKAEDAGKVPYSATWKGAFLAPYYGRFNFKNSGTASFGLVIDNKNIAPGSDVILAEGFHKVVISSSRRTVSDTLQINVKGTGLSDSSYRGTEVLKLDGKYLYNFGIVGLHGYYINGNNLDLANKDSEIIDTNMQFDGAVYTSSAFWKGTIDIPEQGEYFINASCNGFVRIVIDGNLYWEQSNGRAAEQAEQYFKDKPMKRVTSFNLSKGKHKITVYDLNSNILHLMWNKAGQSSQPVPVEVLEPDYEISLK